MPRPSLRRLHPLSPVFLLIADMRRFIVPLVGLAIFGYYDHTSLWPFIGIGLVMLDSLRKFVTCRYGIVDGVVLVNEGLLGRSHRKLPVGRIKKVSLHQSALQRALGVASISMTTVVGNEPEVELSVVALKDAVAMEALVHGARHAGEFKQTDPAELIMAMPLGDVLRLGVISPKAFVILASVIAGFFASRPERYIPAAESLFDGVLKWLGDVAGIAPGERIGVALFVLVMLLILVSRLVSVVIAFLQYHGFRLSKAGALFTVERGLLAKWRTSVAQNRIQKLTMLESPLHRWFGRRSVKALTTEPAGLHRLFRSVAPLAPIAACESLIDAVFSKGHWLAMTWHSPDKSAAWRLLLWALPLLASAAFAAGLWLEGWIWIASLFLPLAACTAFIAWRRTYHAGYAFDGEVIAVRDGVWFRRWRIAQLDRVQALALSRSPLDRLCGTSTLQLDTPSNRMVMPTLNIRFLPESDASWLFHRIGVLLSKKTLPAK